MQKLKIFMLALTWFAGAQTQLFAQGTAFTYQGQLNNAGAPAHGSYDFTFTLFLTNISGTALAGPVTNAATAVTNGLFTTLVNLGPVFTGSSNWLEIAVRTNGSGAFTTLSPRNQVTPAPYAISAENVSGGIAASQLTSGVVPTNVIAGFQGPLFETVGGGQGNVANNTYATIGGGFGNTAGFQGTVGGGGNNLATGYYSTVPGGDNNQASGQYSLAAGQRAKALHQGAFVWADSQPADFSSTTNDQFLIRAQGGVGIGTNVTAGSALSVAGNVSATSFSGSGSGLTNVSAASLTGTIPNGSLGPGAAAANLAAGNQSAVPSGGVILSAAGGAQEQNLLNDGYVKIGSATIVPENWNTNLATGPADTGELTAGRYGHTAVWTGSEMIIWGGLENFIVAAFGTTYNNGAIYNPSANTWTGINSNSGLSPRYLQVAVWTGSRMIIWGGDNGTNISLNNGASYNPATDSWTPISNHNAPAPRDEATAVWTGTNMIVWGGYTNYVDVASDSWDQQAEPSGGIYNPATDTWSAMSTNGSPQLCIGHTAVWTGTSMIIYGGSYYPHYSQEGTPFPFSGGRYNPANNTWSSIATNGSAGPRTAHTAVWTGTNMIVWGGLGSLAWDTNSGALYNPANNTWTAMTLTGAPSPRRQQSAVWTGTEMAIWGGGLPDPVFPVDYNDGGLYNPALNTWIAITTNGAPSIRDSETVIWTGNAMLIWGGENNETIPNSDPEPGGVFYPAFNLWEVMPDAPGSGEPGARQSATAVWTGSEMLVWGGENSGFSLHSGGSFDPVANAWTPITTTNAPTARQGHTAVWTGNSMVVWGGENGGATENSGGRYYPATGSWLATSTMNAPISRASHVAVWDGTEMLVWGGYETTLLNPAAGGRYNPATDTWILMNTTNEPADASQAAGVWTGNGMLVWGGNTGNELGTNFTSVGGIYYPATDSWFLMATNHAPSARGGHSAVWSGTQCVVFGGFNGATNLNTGASYTVDSDSWTTLSMSNAPPALSGCNTVWTGNLMLVNGGLISSNNYNPAIEIYNPVQNSWATSSLPPLGSPLFYGTVNSCAVWTGSGMLAWGGTNYYAGYYNQPYLYTPQQNMDLLLRP